MKLRDILRRWRARLDDFEDPPLWTDADGVEFANAAEREACERALLLPAIDADSPILSLDGEADTAIYRVDERLFRVDSCMWNGQFLSPIARATLNDQKQRYDTSLYGSYFRHPTWTGPLDWSNLTGTPRYFVFENGVLTLVRKPTIAAPIRMTGWRYPMNPLELANKDGEPEILPRYHEDLVHWMVYLAYDNVDADKRDPEERDKAERKFTERFGPRQTADTQRSRTEERTNQVVFNPDW